MKKANIIYPIIIPVLITLAILTVGRIGFTVYDISVHNRLHSHQQVSNPERTFFNTQLQVRQWLFTIAGIIYTVILCMWIYREYKNVREINNGSTKYKPLLAALSPVIPVFNLFAPFGVFIEIWDAYCNDVTENAKGRSLIKQWFFLFIVSTMFSRILTTIINNGAHDTYLLYYSIILYAVQIHYFIITIRLIKKINEAGENYYLYTNFLVRESEL